MSWEMVKLGDVCEINMGKTPSRSNPKYWGGSNSWVSIADLKGDYFITKTKEKITDLGIKESGIKVVAKGTLLYSFKLSIGKIAITKNELYTNEAIVALPIKDREKLDLSYLYYATQKVNLSNIGDKAVKGITLNKEKLKSLQIPLPPLSTQKRIAEILDKADALRKADRQLLKHYDNLAQSLFIDLFGDPVKNEKGIPLSELASINPTKSKLKIEDKTKVSFVPMTNVGEKGEFNNSIVRQYQEVKSGFTFFEENDVLFAKITPCMENGKGAIARNLENGIGFGSTEFHVLRPNSQITAEYIYSLISLPTFRKYAEINMTGSAGQKRVGTSFFKKVKINIPPIALQNRFAGQIQNIEQQKEKVKAQLLASEHLFQALLKQAFSGLLA